MIYFYCGGGDELTCHIQLPYCIQFQPKDDQASYISGTVQNDTVVIDYILCGNNFMVTDRNVVLSLHGYYIHNSVWIAAVGEELPCE